LNLISSNQSKIMNTLHLAYISTLLLCYQLMLAGAQFGIKKKTPNEILKEGATEDNTVDELDGLVNFEDDPELEEAIKQFADMSHEEMVQTIEEMKELFHDDPESLKELDSVIEELSQMNAEEIQANLDAIMAEEAVAQSMAETLELLQNADEKVFEEKILAQKDVILKNIVESGIMPKEELEIFENDEAAWEEELRLIWKELKSQASASASDTSSTLLNDEL